MHTFTSMIWPGRQSGGSRQGTALPHAEEGSCRERHEVELTQQTRYRRRRSSRPLGHGPTTS